MEQFIIDISDNLSYKCSVCKSCLTNVILYTCGHYICTSCHKSNDKYCTECKQSIVIDVDDKSVDLILSKILNVIVECKKCKLRCTYGNFRKHCLSCIMDLNNAIVECTICDSELTYDEFTKHCIDCFVKNKNIICIQCGEYMKYCDFNTHRLVCNIDLKQVENIECASCRSYIQNIEFKKHCFDCVDNIRRMMIKCKKYDVKLRYREYEQHWYDHNISKSDISASLKQIQIFE